MPSRPFGAFAGDIIQTVDWALEVTSCCNHYRSRTSGSFFVLYGGVELPSSRPASACPQLLRHYHRSLLSSQPRKTIPLRLG
nr:hypothetical protein CFP56_70521 [Quercus suber]